VGDPAAPVSGGKVEASDATESTGDADTDASASDA
jgi:hypothetical protein